MNIKLIITEKPTTIFSHQDDRQVNIQPNQIELYLSVLVLVCCFNDSYFTKINDMFPLYIPADKSVFFCPGGCSV